MSSAWLADLGAASWSALWLPVLAWTALAIAAEAALRLGRAGDRMGLGIRGALLAALPGLVVVPPVLARWVPSLLPQHSLPTPLPVPAGLPSVEPSLALPSLTPVGIAPASASLGDLALGGATLAAGIGAAFGLGVLIGGLVWLHRYRQSLPDATPTVQAEARSLADELGIRSRLEVALAEPASAPFTVGWRRPLVAIPADLRDDDLRLALAHELIHVRESHYGWSLAERAVRALFLWHPLTHVLGRGLALDRERAADAAVVGQWPGKVQSYGRLLHAIAARPSPSLALGASSSSLIHRLSAMTRPRPDRRLVAAAAGFALFVAPLLIASAAVPDPPPAPAPTPASAFNAESASADTLDQYVAARHGRHDEEGGFHLDIELRPGSPRAVAVAIADHRSAGPYPGTLTVRYDGGTVERTSLRYPAPPPPVSSGSRYPSDSLDAYVARRSGSYSDRGNRVEIQLKPGVSRAVAERVATHYSDGDLDGTLVVIYDGGEITRSSLRNGGLPPPPPPPPGLLAPAEGGTFPGVIENRSYYRNGRIRIRLTPGQPRVVADWIADWYSDGSRPGQITVVYDGGTVTRSTLRDDLPPPPPPPPPPPAPGPPPPSPAAPPPPPPLGYSATSADAALEAEIEEMARTLALLERQTEVARANESEAERAAEMARIAAESRRVQARLAERLATSAEMRRQLADLAEAAATLRRAQQGLQRSQ